MKRFLMIVRTAALLFTVTATASPLTALAAPAPLPPGNAIPLTIRPTPGTQSRQIGAQTLAQNGCNISANNMNFGTYDIFSTTPLTSTMLFTVNCGRYYGGGYLYITFSTGSSGTYTNRTMSNGTDTLNYNIYAEAAHTNVVGDGTNNTTYYYAYSYGGGFYGSATVYGLLPAQQNVSPGTYTDVVTITLSF